MWRAVRKANVVTGFCPLLYFSLPFLLEREPELVYIALTDPIGVGGDDASALVGSISKSLLFLCSFW